MKKAIDERTKEIIRKRREKECFAYCDRAVWYATLTQDQKKAVRVWRAKWLRATETGICPEKPWWIK